MISPVLFLTKLYGTIHDKWNNFGTQVQRYNVIIYLKMLLKLGVMVG